jgi:hypothetical protein
MIRKCGNVHNSFPPIGQYGTGLHEALRMLLHRRNISHVSTGLLLSWRSQLLFRQLIEALNPFRPRYHHVCGVTPVHA